MFEGDETDATHRAWEEHSKGSQGIKFSNEALMGETVATSLCKPCQLRWSGVRKRGDVGQGQHRDALGRAGTSVAALGL